MNFFILKFEFSVSANLLGICIALAAFQPVSLNNIHMELQGTTNLLVFTPKFSTACIHNIFSKSLNVFQYLVLKIKIKNVEKVLYRSLFLLGDVQRHIYLLKRKIYETYRKGEKQFVHSC